MGSVNGCGIMSAALVFSLGGLLGVHTYLLLSNGSTLEMGQLMEHNPFNRTSNVLRTNKPKKSCFGKRRVSREF